MADRAEVRRLNAVRELAAESYVSQVSKAVRQFKECAIAKGINSFTVSIHRIKEADARRLLVLKQYSDEFGLTYCEAIGVVLEHWRKRRQIMEKSKLPAPIANLCGRVAYAAIREYVEREYPNHEHDELRRELQRESLLHARERLLTQSYKAVELPGYMHDAESERQLRDSAVRRLKQDLRNFRGNPWR